MTWFEHLSGDIYVAENQHCISNNAILNRSAHMQHVK